MKQSVKLGFMQPDKCVCINLVYFVPKVAFDLYREANLFGWNAIQEGWANFTQYLVARGLGDLYIHTDTEHVVRMGLVEDKIIRTEEPVRVDECLHLKHADGGESTRLFQFDRFRPTPTARAGLFEIYPDADRYLGSQELVYVAMAVESRVADNTYRRDLIQMVAEGACTAASMRAFAETCEERQAKVHVEASVESNGYAILGKSAEEPTQPTRLYTVGLCQFENYEVYVNEVFPAYQLGVLMAKIALMVAEQRSIEAINDHLKGLPNFLKNRPRLIRSRTVKIEDMFVHRTREQFDAYRLMLDY